MKLRFKRFDGRRMARVDVTDEDSGQIVGYIDSNGVGFDNYGGIDISLFEGKYRTTVNRYDACVGFIMGVETVLNHMIRISAPTTRLSTNAA